MRNPGVQFARGALLAGALIATACSPGRAPDSRIAAVAAMAPESWNATRQARSGIDREWIKRFGDPVLTALVYEAMAGNLDLQVAAERVRRAEAVARLRGAERMPRVDGRLNGTRQKQRFIGLPFGGDFISENYGASVDINWELDVWGRARAGQSAAIADVQAQAFDFRAAQTSLAAQVAKAWFALGEANDQIVLAQAAVEVRKKAEAAIGERFARALVEEGGAASQLRLAQSDVASSSATLAFWKGQRERALRQVELLLGHYPQGKFLPNRGLPRAPSRPPAGLPSELLLRRPDILAAERRYAAAGRRVKQAHLAQYPSFSLTGSRGTNTDSLHEVLDSQFGVWSYGGNLVQPILDAGRIRENKRIAQSDERLALGQLQQVVLQAFGEVEQALVAETYFAEREVSIEKAARLADEAASAALQDFADGTVDAITLLNAQDRKVQTALRLADLRRLRLDNRVNLHLALGGDFVLRGK